MNFLVVRDITGLREEILMDIDYSSFSYDYEKNSSRGVKFSVVRTPYNSLTYDYLSNETIILFEGQSYVVKNCIDKTIGDMQTKDITAQHIMFECQNHFVDDEVEGSKTYSIQEYFDFAFKGNALGYKVFFKGEFPKVEIENMGKKNGMEFLNEGAESFSAIYFADNKNITIYSEKEFYKQSDVVLRYRYNTEDITVTTDTSNLKTYIKAYGKKKDTEDKNYNKVQVKALDFVGKFEKTGTFYTEEINANFSTSIDARWANDSLSFRLKKDKQGGLLDVYLDNKKIKTLSCWNAKAKTENLTLVDKVSKGKHSVKFIFVGEDPAHKMEKGKKARGYVGTEDAEIIKMVADVTGNNAYHAIATYASPNMSLYGKRIAASVYDERFTDATKLKEWAKKQITDVPETTLDMSYKGQERLTEKDTLYFIHTAMEFNTELKMVRLSRPHPFVNESATVGFSNSKKDVLKMQQQINNNLKKAANNLKGTTQNLSGIQSQLSQLSNNELITELVGSVKK